MENYVKGAEKFYSAPFQLPLKTTLYLALNKQMVEISGCSVTSCQDERAVEWEEKGGRIERSTESAPRLSTHPIAPPKVLNIIILFWFWD
ncbi:hypothetical protein MHYP_G00022700 [Metynnis hypsauchen]